MRPAMSTAEPPTEQPGLSEEAASYAALGVDIESLSSAVGRHWGLGDDVMHMVRRLAPDAPVRKPDHDADVLRITASAANEAVDALHETTPARVVAGIQHVAQRYGRALGVGPRDIQDALKAARERLRRGSSPEEPVERDGVAAE
jgi:non-specific serine/threonine protein kinase